MNNQRDSLASLIRQRLIVWNLWDELVQKVGITELEWAIDDSVEFHLGAEEIGTSDAAHMVDGLLRRLGQPGLWDESRKR